MLEPKQNKNTKTPFQTDSCSQLFEALSSATAADEIIVDFDETLLLRNSTAEYLSFFKPSLAAAVVFRALSVLRPWRWLTPRSSDWSRDWFQVVVLTFLLPWNLLRWKRRAREIAQNYSNTELAAALSKTQAQVTIATYGYRFVVEPILREMEVKPTKLVACRFWGAVRDRVSGKVELLGLDSRKEEAGKLIAVTDSEADEPLLERCDLPFLIRWPEAKSRAPFAEVYLPFLYLTKVKWPERNYLFRNILGDDFPLYLLAFGLAASQPLWTGLVLALLTLSFWCLYERGYNENDEVGELKESDPKLSEAYFRREFHVPEKTAWAWALIFGIFAVWVHEGSYSGFFESQTLQGFWRSMAIWSVILVGCRLIFSVYNHSQKSVRPVLYPILQVFRYVGLAALLPISFVGCLALCAQVTARSLNYLVYRKSGGKDWPEIPEQVIRLGIFTLLVFASIPIFEVEIFSPITVVIFLWFLFRCSKQILSILGPVFSSKQSQSSSGVFSSREGLEGQAKELEQDQSKTGLGDRVA